MRRMKRGTYKEDEFQTSMQKIMKYIVRHRETSIWVGVVFILAVVLVIYFLSSGEQQNTEAELLHTQAMGFISTGRLQEAENVLLDLTQRFENTRPGKIGLYYLGIVYYHTGRFDESLHYFDRFLNLQKRDYLLVPSALFGAGCSAEGLKDYEKALSYYEKIIKDKDSDFYLLGMLAYGRTNGIIGNTEKAKEILKELLDQNPSPDITSEAKFYLGYFNE